MKNHKPTWTTEELKVYLLLFLMHSNFTKKNHIDFTSIHISETEINKMQTEFNADNDYQGIQKICKAIEDKNYSKNQLQAFLFEVKNLLVRAKKEHRIIMNNCFAGIERILITAA